MKTSLLFLLSHLLCLVAGAEHHVKHLFILSGQSNMQGHRPDEAFTPTVEKALGKDKVIVVQDALGGQPLLVAMVQAGEPVDTTPTLTEMRAWCDQSIAALPPAVCRLQAPDAFPLRPTRILQKMAETA